MGPSMRSKLENRLATMENNHDNKLVKANAKLKSTHDPLVQTQKQISTMMEERLAFLKFSATTQSANRKENLQLSCFHFLFPVLGVQHCRVLYVHSLFF